jgi:hypothetical protein
MNEKLQMTRSEMLAWAVSSRAIGCVVKVEKYHDQIFAPQNLDWVLPANEYMWGYISADGTVDQWEYFEK